MQHKFAENGDPDASSSGTCFRAAQAVANQQGAVLPLRSSGNETGPHPAGRATVDGTPVVASSERDPSPLERTNHTSKPEDLRSIPIRKVVLACLTSAVLLTGGTIIAMALTTAPHAIAGLSSREVVGIDVIVFLSGLMSGLSGFGFSAVGAVSLLLFPPVVQVPLFQTLSTANQFLSASQLREDMPRSPKALWAGPGPCMLGGAVGVPIGIWILAHLPAPRLMLAFGALLTAYSVYSLCKPAGLRMRGLGTPLVGAMVGFVGGVMGGFTAFPGAAVVVWTGLRGLPKAEHRGIVQPYIILSQIYSIVLLAWLHPSYLDYRFWVLLVLTAPAVLPGTLAGLALYRRMSDFNFKRVTFLLLGLSGLAVLVKAAGAIIAKGY